MITLLLQLDTVWLHCDYSVPNACPHHVCCWFNLYFIYCKFKTILLYIKMMTKSITFVVYQFTSPHAMPHLLPRYHYSKLQMLNAKIFYVHYNCITQIPVLCHTVPQAISQKPWPYAVTKNIIKHIMFPRVIYLCDIRNLLVPSQRKIILLHETLISYLYCVFAFKHVKHNPLCLVTNICASQECTIHSAPLQQQRGP